MLIGRSSLSAPRHPNHLPVSIARSTIAIASAVCLPLAIALFSEATRSDASTEAYAAQANTLCVTIARWQQIDIAESHNANESTRPLR
jgi:hypothetical protein